MTDKEAIYNLNHIYGIVSPDIQRSLDLAIKALEQSSQGDIRWTDKLSVKSNGDIINFEGRVVGHINLEEMKGGTE